MLAPDSLLTSLKLFARVLETVLTTWQYAGAVAAGVLLGLLARRRPDAGPAVLLPCRPLRLLSLGAGTVLACGYLCTVITYPVFGTRVLTTERTWNDYLLPYVLLLVATGALLGRALRRAGRPAALRYAAAAVSAAVCAAAVAGLAVPLHRLGGDMRDRAERWDRQDRFLRERAASGARTAPYTPNTVARMLEPFGAGAHARGRRAASPTTTAWTASPTAGAPRRPAPRSGPARPGRGGTRRGVPRHVPLGLPHHVVGRRFASW